MINLNNFRKKVYSQFEEDGITEKIFELIGTTNKVCVEFGTEKGTECCSKILWEDHGFTQILFDNKQENDEINLKKYHITINNVLDIFEENNVPAEPDFLCVDIDSYDFYVLHRILDKYAPRVMILEHNPTFLREDKVIKLDYEGTFKEPTQTVPSLKIKDGKVVKLEYVEIFEHNESLMYTSYMGASAKAWHNSLRKKYDLVCHEAGGINVFFVRRGILNESIIENFNDFEKLYRQHSWLENAYPPHPPNYPILTSTQALELLSLKINKK